MRSMMQWLIAYVLFAGLVSLTATAVLMRLRLPAAPANIRMPSHGKEIYTAWVGGGFLIAATMGLWFSDLDSIVFACCIALLWLGWWKEKHDFHRGWWRGALILISAMLVMHRFVFDGLGWGEKLLYIVCLSGAMGFAPLVEERGESVAGTVFWLGGGLAVSAAHSGVYGYDLAALASGLAVGAFSVVFAELGPHRVAMGRAVCSQAGLLLAVVLLLGVNRGIWSFWFSLMILLPLLAYAVATRLGAIAFGSWMMGHLPVATCAYLALLFEHKTAPATMIVLFGWGVVFLLFQIRR